ncbi:MAG TPA: hypothetical protein VLC09_06670, partial [Polyangiaceae bacterium]|nr:hypothetical protein [Polyangiaceae bacterium]
MTSIATRILGISLVLGSAGFTVACDDGGDGGGGGTGGLPTASGGATGTGGAAPGTGGAAPGTGGSAPAEGCNIGTGTGTFTR